MTTTPQDQAQPDATREALAAEAKRLVSDVIDLLPGVPHLYAPSRLVKAEQAAWATIDKLATTPPTPLCTICGGNDMDMPCAYPSERYEKCPRTKRLESARVAVVAPPAAQVAAAEPELVASLLDDLIKTSEGIGRADAWRYHDAKLQLQQQRREAYRRMTEAFGVVVFDGPDAFAEVDAAKARLDAEIETAGGFEAWKAKAGIPTAQVEAAGWKLVPVEPTPEMLLALKGAGQGGRERWAAMLSAAPPAPQLTQAVRDVLAERQRHVTEEGWTPEHDDEHTTGGMAFAAAAYAVHSHAGPTMSQPLWRWTGWAAKWFKPKSARQDLVRACALCLAELERLDRAATPPAPAGEHL